MKKFLAAECGTLFAETTMFSQFASKANADVLISKIMEKEIQNHLERFAAIAGRYQLVESLAYITRLQQDFSFFAANEEINIGLKTLMALVKSEMEKRL